MPPESHSTTIASSVVELVSGLVMVVVGIALQVAGSQMNPSNALVTVCGGTLAALGGVLISWIAGRILADKQRADADAKSRQEAKTAMDVAQAEVDEKLNNLSRVLGQAAGQISQAVEKVEAGLVSSVTGFELVSQANRMVYGQVNEIAVIRKSRFDSAYLIDTASRLDDLARELTSRTHGENGSTDSEALASVREKLETVREDLSKGTASQARAAAEADATCPYCDAPARVLLGTTPGDTATSTCVKCGETFNSHRSSTGSAFSRRMGPREVEGVPTRPRWNFRCLQCHHALSAANNGKGERLMVCPTCFSALMVDPASETVNQIEAFERQDALAPYRSGTRPKASCPKCGSRINLPLRYAEGFFGYCMEDRVVLTVTDEAWNTLLDDAVVGR